MSDLLANAVNTIGVGSASERGPIPVGRFSLAYLKRALAIVEALCESPDDDVLIARTTVSNDDGTGALMVRPLDAVMRAEPGREIWIVLAPKDSWEPREP